MPDAKKPEELVLCIDSNALMRLFAENAGDPSAVWLANNPKTRPSAWLPEIRKAFLPRSEAEISPSWRHIATYTVLSCRDHVFTYRRGVSGSEGRLHGRLSIGIGGHVTLEDYRSDDTADDLADAIWSASTREVYEEIGWFPAASWTNKGLIASSASAVDKVHLGAVSMARIVCRDQIEVREDCLADPRWMTLDELAAHAGEMESWSVIVAREVLGVGQTEATR